MTVTVGVLLGDWAVGSLGIYYKVILGQELVGHLNGSTQVTAGVASHVDYEFLHTLAAQVSQAGEHLGECGLGKLVYHYVADALLG